jgi:hypothetical protein
MRATGSDPFRVDNGFAPGLLAPTTMARPRLTEV